VPLLQVKYLISGFAVLVTTLVRNEHWAGLGLDRIQSITNFVDIEMDPVCNSLQNLGTGPDLD